MIKACIQDMVCTVLVLIPVSVMSACLIIAVLDNVSQSFHDWLRKE